MRTDFETLRALSVYTVNFLKDAGFIQFSMDKRLDLVDALATELGVSFSTDEDIKEQSIDEVQEKMGYAEIPDDITESEMFNHARKEIIKGFNGETIGGLYLVESLRQIAIRISTFLLTSDLIEDVFGTDEELVNFLVTKLRGFSVKRA